MAGMDVTPLQMSRSSQAASRVAKSPIAEYITLSGVTFSYPRQRAVLTDFNLSVARGELLVIVGQSGCGKTTALNLIAGFEKPHKGTVLIDGEPITGPGPDQLVVFQGDRSLLGWLTAINNIEFGLKITGMSRQESRRRALDMLDRVGLAGQGDKYPHELSGGMKQRIQLARVLVCLQRVLLMDEPFAAVDALTRTALQDQLLNLLHDTDATVVFITHDIAEAVTLADRIVVMGRGGTVRETLEFDLAQPRKRGSAEFASLYDKLERALRES